MGYSPWGCKSRRSLAQHPLLYLASLPVLDSLNRLNFLFIMDIFSFLFEWMAIFYSVLDIVNVIQGTEYFYILIIYLSFVLRCSRVTWTQFL